MGLFLLAVTLGILSLGVISLRDALEKRWAAAPASQPPRERVFSVHVTRVRPVTVAPVISAYGEIRSRRTLDLRAPVSGTVLFMSEHFVDAGQVSTGELLIRLDPSNARSALEVVKTDVREAQAEAEDAQAALALAHDELAAARNQVDLRKSALTRQKNLADRGVGTEAAIETAALALAAANQAVLARRQALAQAQTRASRAKTAMARQEIRLKDAARKLDDTEIYAEFSGVLGSVNALKGGLVGVNERLARLIDPNALEVVFRLSDAQFSHLTDGARRDALGNRVKVRMDVSGATASAEGVIERVAGEVGAGQTGRQVFARIKPAAGSAFRPGDFVSVDVTEPPMENVAVLPALAVNSRGRVLALGENDRLEEVGVEVLRHQRDEVIVRVGALAGREIVSARSPLLGAGIRVKPVRPEIAAALDTPELMELSRERRARLVAFVTSNVNIPADAKERMLSRLKQPKVPVRMVERIERRIGG